MPVTHTNRGALGRLYSSKLGLISAKTGNYVVTNGDSGTYFTNQGAAGAVFFTLPAQETGLWYVFMNVEAQDITVVADTADTIATFNDVAADNVAFSTANEKVGSGFLVWCDGTNWIATCWSAPAATLTVGT